MATGDPYIGRQAAIGFGVETTPGTAVAPGAWMRWLDQNFQNRTNVIENESAMGVVDRVNGSAVTHTWSEGTVSGKVTDVVIGYLLTGLYGLPTTTGPASTIYTHTWAMNQSSIGKTLTVALADGIQDQRHAYGVVDTIELSAETGGWVQVSSAIKARAGANSTETVILASEKEFTSKDITVKLAANVAGLSGATALKARSVRLNLERPSEAFVPLGTSTNVEFDRGVYEARGEVVVRYTDTQYETDFLANTIKALGISIVNGTTELNFTAPQVRYRELERSTDRDGIVTQTIGFFCEFSTADNYSIQPVLKNTKTAYTS